MQLVPAIAALAATATTVSVMTFGAATATATVRVESPPTTTSPPSGGGGNGFDLVAEANEPGTPDKTAPTQPHWTNCTYHEVTVMGNNRDERNGVKIFHIDAQRWKHDANAGTFSRWARRTCVWSTNPEKFRSTYEWEILTSPDPALGIEPSYDRVVKQVKPPTPNLSPVGPGYVNLGMWLATADPVVNPVVARAATANTWAEVTARLATTTFDMGFDGDGDGKSDTVTCAGIGDPIPASAIDSVDQSPACGYTYRDIGGTGTITITATWTVTWELSDGRTGSRDDIVLGTSVPYEVKEIQTVGVSSG